MGAACGRRGAVRAAPVAAAGAAPAVLHILDGITASIVQLADRKSDAFKTLRQGLGYCWSITVSRCRTPASRSWRNGSPAPTPTSGWIIRENAEKYRLGEDGRGMG